MVYVEKGSDVSDTGPDYAALLQRHGVRPTSQRLAVARVLLDKARHLSADQVMWRVKRERQCVSLATIYNTLKLFRRRGLVSMVVIEPGKVYYDSNTEPHDHFYNEDTGELIDSSGQMTLRGVYPLPVGTKPLGMNVVVRVCSHARFRKNPPEGSETALLEGSEAAPTHVPE